LGICVESPWLKTVPAIASPTMPPTWRRKVRVLVAVPNRSRGAAFWMTTVKTDIEGPIPRPVSASQSQRVGVAVDGLRWVIRKLPTIRTPRPIRSSALYRPVRVR
jgi:hypothetical protein